MTHKDHDLLKWEPPKEKLKYTNNDPNHKLVMWMNSLEFEPGCDNKRLYELTEETEIVEEMWPLSLSCMHQDQCNDEKFQKELKILMKQHPFKYTKMKIEGIELIHEHDRILVPKGSQQRILNWYHKCSVIQEL